MKAAGVYLAIAVALALQTTLAQFTSEDRIWFDLVLVAVVYAALVTGPVTGMMAGAIGGLAQDALSGGIVGVGGLAKTVVGFVIGVIGSQFIVQQQVPRFVIFFGATLLHAACFLGLYVLLDGRGFPSPYVRVLIEALVNAGAGVLVFQLTDSLPGALARRRARRTQVRGWRLRG